MLVYIIYLCVDYISIFISSESFTLLKRGIATAERQEVQLAAGI